MSNKIHDIEAKLNNYATRCFCDTADRDYIHARLAYRHALLPQFRWSAIHCLEKYGKCILLLNRIDGKEVNGKKIGHAVLESISRVKAAGRFELQMSSSTLEFIKRLEYSAAHRYLESSWYTMTGDLNRLDRAVIEIRRYCQVLDFEIERNGVKTNLFTLNLDRITPKEGQPLNNVHLIGGWLERVLEDRRHPARAALLWDNSFFGSPSENERATWEYSGSENSPFDLHPDVVDELEKYIFIPKWLTMEVRQQAMLRLKGNQGKPTQ